MPQVCVVALVVAISGTSEIRVRVLLTGHVRRTVNVIAWAGPSFDNAFVKFV